MRAKSSSTLELAILGLIDEGPKTGYEIRKLFHDSALASYSDSPGSIYPALHRLVRRRLVARGVQPGPRPRRVFRLTRAGDAALRTWLDEPVTVADIGRPEGVLELKLSFMSTSHASRLHGFLAEWRAAAVAWLDATEQSLAPLAGGLSPSARLAVELGLELVRTRIAFLGRARRRKR